MLKLNIDGIPEGLKKNKRWVGFEIGKNGKKPIDPKSIGGFTSYASISDPSTWGTFEEALKLVEAGLCDGIGYAITKDDKLIFIDIDLHLDKLTSEDEKQKTGKFFNVLCRDIKRFQTYMETSISGTGVHLLARGTLDETLKTGASPIAPVEIYDNNRFIIMTGNKVEDFDISDDEFMLRGIHAFHKQFFQKKSPSSEYEVGQERVDPIDGEKYSDQQVLSVALKDQKFNLLWNDKWAEVVDDQGRPLYTQQHYADFALITKLTYYTGNSPSQVERLFKQSPCYLAYGRDGKWTKYESDIKKDIQKASSTCTKVYMPAEVVQVDTQGDAGKVDGSQIVLFVEGKPQFQSIKKWLDDEQDPLVKDPELKSYLIEYIKKYESKNIICIPDLHKEDNNVNGWTSIVKRVSGEQLKFSSKFGLYYIWRENRYIGCMDPEILINYITEILGLVEHSAFKYVVEKAAKRDDQNAGDFEKSALKLLNSSKRYVSVAHAKDVLKKYKGMDVGNDLLGYYESPYINMKNGVLDLTAKQLLPHSPTYNQHKITGCSYDPDATCPEFAGMMERLLPDKAVRREFQKAVGLCLAKEQLPAKKVLMLLIGPKDTGKTTVLNILVDVLGEYGASVDNSLLMQTNKDKTRGPEMYDFRETLMITTSEASENDKLDTGRVKALTGETTISVRNNYSTSMDKFKMIGLIFIDSNFKPYIPPRDTAAWGRLRLFPFEQVIIQKDPTLKSKLEQEKAGIFNWMLQGLSLVLEEKEIFETDSMQVYKGEYRKEMDITQQFIEDCLEKNENTTDRIQTTLLFSTYKNWCRDNNFKPTIRNKFYEEISKTFEKKKSGIEYFVGVRLSEMGVLYANMEEKTQQQFAKQKKELLGGDGVGLTYETLKYAYFNNSKGWFIQNIKSEYQFHDKGSMYDRYNDWCIEYHLMPIKKPDFMAKVSYLFEKMGGSTISADDLEKVKEIWSQS